MEYQLKSGMYNANWGFSMHYVHSEKNYCAPLLYDLSRQMMRRQKERRRVSRRDSGVEAAYLPKANSRESEL